MDPNDNRRRQTPSASTVYTLIYKREMRSRIAGLLHPVRYPLENNVKRIIYLIMSIPETSYYTIYVFSNLLKHLLYFGSSLSS